MRSMVVELYGAVESIEFDFAFHFVRLDSIVLV